MESKTTTTTKPARITPALTPQYIEDEAQAAAAAAVTTKAKPASKVVRTVGKPLSDEQKKARAEKAAATKQANAYTFVGLAVATIMGFLSKGSPFYGRALTYHAAQHTVFPRPRNAGEIARLMALKEADARREIAEITRQHDARILAAGNKTAQACFDIFMSNRSK